MIQLGNQTFAKNFVSLDDESGLVNKWNIASGHLQIIFTKKNVLFSKYQFFDRRLK